MTVSALPVAAMMNGTDADPAYPSANSNDYWFSGALMESLSDSVGISDNNYKVSWTLKNTMGYAISGDYAYVVTKDSKLCKISLEDGEEVKSVATTATSYDWPAVYGDLVLDPMSGTVYDLDLNQQYRIDATGCQAYYDEGFWYVVQNNGECKCFSATDEDPSSGTNIQSTKWTSTFTFFISEYALPAPLAFGDKALYYPGIGATDQTKRILYCIDKSSGTQLDAFEMTGIQGTYWNGGLISCSGGNIYVSAHWDTAFAPIGDGTKPVFVKVPLKSDGKFDTGSVQYICNGVDDSYSSKMVQVGDLGFACTGRSFMVFDLKNDASIIARTEVDTRLSKTESNIAIATGSEDLIYGYVSPAGGPTSFTQNVDGLICFEYRISTKDIRLFDLTVGVGGATATQGIKIGPNGEVLFAKTDNTLYCITQATYTVKFDGNGGTGTMKDATEISGEYTLPLCTFTAPEGKKFEGWAYSPEGPQISGFAIEVTSDITLYAHWEDIPASAYTVEFDANGGSGIMADATGVAGMYALPDSLFTPPGGMIFDGWSLSPTGSAITHPYIDVTEDVTLYAIWRSETCRTHTVTYDIGEGSGEAPTQEPVQEGTEFEVKGYDGTRKGYAFGGWSYGDSTYKAGDTIEMGAADIVLQAIWTKTRTFVPIPNDGDIEPAIPVFPNRTADDGDGGSASAAIIATGCVIALLAILALMSYDRIRR